MCKFCDSDIKIGCYISSNLPMSSPRSAQIFLFCSFPLVLPILSKLQHLVLVSALLILQYLQSVKIKNLVFPLVFTFSLKVRWGDILKPCPQKIIKRISPIWEDFSMRSTPEVSFLLVIHISLYSHNSGISRNHLTKCSDQRKVYLVRIYHWKIFCIFFLLVILLQHHELINSPVP